MQNGRVTDGDVVAQDQGPALGLPLAFVRHVQHATVLDVAPRPDPYPVDVPPGRGHRPDGAVVTDGDVTADVRLGSNVNPLPQHRFAVHEAIS